MKSQDRYFIGPGLRDKLRDVIRKHDTTAFGLGSAEIPVRLQDAPRDSVSPGVLKFGRVSETWVKGAYAVVEELSAAGQPLQTEDQDAPTFTARNYFATVAVNSGYKNVLCGNVGGLWFLIAAECG